MKLNISLLSAGLIGFGLLTLGVVQGAVAQTPPPKTVKFEAAKLPGGASETFSADSLNSLKPDSRFRVPLWPGTIINAVTAIANACQEYNLPATTTTEGRKCVGKIFRDIQSRDVKIHANTTPACSMNVTIDDCICTAVDKIIIGPPAPKTTAAVIDEISALVNILAE